jgi:hypothetical protein
VNTAVAIMAFNRPQTLARVFAVVRAARPARLLLVCDGPRPDRAGEALRCAEVRRILEGVDWPCEVERNYSEVNMGCRARIASGLDWVFARAEEAIILEDDTLPNASFFPYCDELLARYRDDERVQMICGYNLLGRGEASGASYWFSAHPRVWGWASWRRAWRGYDETMAEWPAFKATSGWTSRTRDERAHWGPFLEGVKNGTVDTWDAQLTLLAWRTGRLSVIPSSNLVNNIGFGPDSTNTRSPDNPSPAVHALSFPMTHPAEVVPSIQLDAACVREELGPRPSRPRALARGVLRWLRDR